MLFIEEAARNKNSNFLLLRNLQRRPDFCFFLNRDENKTHMEEQAFALKKKLEQLQKLQSKISPEEYAKQEAALLDQLQPIETGTFIFTTLIHVVYLTLHSTNLFFLYQLLPLNNE